MFFTSCLLRYLLRSIANGCRIEAAEMLILGESNGKSNGNIRVSLTTPEFILMQLEMSEEMLVRQVNATRVK